MTAILVFVILALTLATGTPIAIAMAATVLISITLFTKVFPIIAVWEVAEDHAVEPGQAAGAVVLGPRSPDPIGAAE